MSASQSLAEFASLAPRRPKRSPASASLSAGRAPASRARIRASSPPATAPRPSPSPAHAPAPPPPPHEILVVEATQADASFPSAHELLDAILASHATTPPPLPAAPEPVAAIPFPADRLDEAETPPAPPVLAATPPSPACLLCVPPTPQHQDAAANAVQGVDERSPSPVLELPVKPRTSSPVLDLPVRPVRPVKSAEPVKPVNPAEPAKKTPSPKKRASPPPPAAPGPTASVSTIEPRSPAAARKSAASPAPRKRRPVYDDSQGSTTPPAPSVASAPKTLGGIARASASRGVAPRVRAAKRPAPTPAAAAPAAVAAPVAVAAPAAVAAAAGADKPATAARPRLTEATADAVPMARFAKPRQATPAASASRAPPPQPPRQPATAASTLAPTLFTRGGGAPIAIAQELVDKAHAALKEPAAAPPSRASVRPFAPRASLAIGAAAVATAAKPAAAVAPSAGVASLFSSGSGKQVSVQAHALEQARAALASPPPSLSNAAPVVSGAPATVPVPQSSSSSSVVSLFASGSGKPVRLPQRAIEAARAALAESPAPAAVAAFATPQPVTAREAETPARSATTTTTTTTAARNASQQQDVADALAALEPGDIPALARTAMPPPPLPPSVAASSRFVTPAPAARRPVPEATADAHKRLSAASKESGEGIVFASGTGRHVQAAHEPNGPGSAQQPKQTGFVSPVLAAAAPARPRPADSAAAAAPHIAGFKSPVTGTRVVTTTTTTTPRAPNAAAAAPPVLSKPFAPPALVSPAPAPAPTPLPPSTQPRAPAPPAQRATAQAATPLASLAFPSRMTARAVAEAALARGVPPTTLQVTLANASRVRFDAVSGLPTGFISDDGGDATAGFGVPGASAAWTANHFRFAVWSLAARERVLGVGRLTAAAVRAKLESRWAREAAGQRSVLHRVWTRSLPPTALMVLVVTAANVDEGAGGGGGMQLRLGDGWYDVAARVDALLASRVRRGALRVGDKMVVSHAGLSGPPEVAAHPLDASRLLALVVNANACAPARWHAKLGMRPEAALRLPLARVQPGGGVVAMVRAVVNRVSPLMLLTTENRRLIVAASASEAAAEEEGRDAMQGTPLLRVELVDESGGKCEVTLWRPDRAVNEGSIVRITSLYPNEARRRLNTCAGSRWFFEDADAEEAARLGYVPRRPAYVDCASEGDVVDTTLVVVMCQGNGAFVLARTGAVAFVAARARAVSEPAGAVVAVRDLRVERLDARTGVLNCSLAETSLMVRANVRRDRLSAHLAQSHAALSEWAASAEGRRAFEAARARVGAILSPMAAVELKMSVADVNMTVTGRKTVEARTAKWWARHPGAQRVKVADKVVSAELDVVAVVGYASFPALVEAEGWEKVCPRAGSVERAVEALREANGTEDELEGGVVALRLRVLDRAPPPPR